MTLPNQPNPVTFNMYERYRNVVAERSDPSPQTVGRFVHWALAAHVSGAIEFDTLEHSLTPYLDRQLMLDDLTGHIGYEPVTFSPKAISVDVEYGSAGVVYKRLFLPQIPTPHRPDNFRQFTFRTDRNQRPTFEVYAETGF